MHTATSQLAMAANRIGGHDREHGAGDDDVGLGGVVDHLHRAAPEELPMQGGAHHELLLGRNGREGWYAFLKNQAQHQAGTDHESEGQAWRRPQQQETGKQRAQQRHEYSKDDRLNQAALPTRAQSG